MAEYCDGGDKTDVVARGLNYKLDSMSDEYLTMYSLFYHPDESVMVYTRPLGFSDDHVDECMMIRHASKEFGRGCTLCGGECYDTMNASTLTLSSGGSRITLLGLGLGSGCRSCYDTMNAFLTATTDRTLDECVTTDRTLVVGGVVARSRSFAPPPAAADANNSSSVQVILLEVVFYNLVSFSVAFLVIALIVDWVHNSEDDEEEEEEGGDVDEGGFDYEILQEGDRDLVDRIRVYMGVPLQVV